MLLSVAQSFYRQAVRFLRPEEVTIAANFVVGFLAFAVYLIEGRYFELSYKGVFFFTLSGFFAQFVARHFNNISYSNIYQIYYFHISLFVDLMYKYNLMIFLSFCIDFWKIRCIDHS